MNIGSDGVFSKFLVNLKKATINVSEHVRYKYVYISIGYLPKSGISGSWYMHVFNFGKH